MTSKLSIAEADYRRTEEKINAATLERLMRNNGTKDRISKLHMFMDELEGRESMAKSRESGYSGIGAGHTKTTIADREAADRQSIQREQEYINGLSTAKATIATLNIELSSARQDSEALRKCLEEERIANKERERELISRLNLKEQEFSTEIQGSLSRQQETISKLLADKQSLTDQVASLMSQLRLSDQKCSKVIQEMKEKFKADLKEAHSQWINSEKAKQNKWKQEKEKEIKEMTIRGLEPEVERMLAKHREEKNRMETEKEEAIRKEKNRLEQEYQTRLDEFKQRVITENESLLAKEKTHLQNHFESLLKDATALSQRQLLETEGRLQKAVESETQNQARLTAYYEGRLSSLQKDHLAHIETIRAEGELERKLMRARLEEELRHQAQSLKVDTSKEEQQRQKKIEDEVQLRIEKEKTRLIKERDEQIKIIVDRLLREKAEEVENAVQEERNRVKARKQETNSQLEDLKTELTVYKERLHEEKVAGHKIKDELSAKDRTIDNLLKEIEESRQTAVRLRAKIKSLEEEAEHLKASQKAADKSYQEQLALEQRKALEQRQELHDLLAKHKVEKDLIIKDLEDKQLQELEALESRIKVLLERKETELDRLREELEEKISLCLKYEELLGRQRRDLLGGLQ